MSTPRREDIEKAVELIGSEKFAALPAEERRQAVAMLADAVRGIAASADGWRDLYEASERGLREAIAVNDQYHARFQRQHELIQQLRGTLEGKRAELERLQADQAGAPLTTH